MRQTVRGRASRVHKSNIRMGGQKRKARCECRAAQVQESSSTECSVRLAAQGVVTAQAVSEGGSECGQALPVPRELTAGCVLCPGRLACTLDNRTY